MSDGRAEIGGQGVGDRVEGKGPWFTPEEKAALRQIAHEDQQAGAAEQRSEIVEARGRRAARRKEQRILRGDITPEDVIEAPEEGEKRIAHEEALHMDKAITRLMERAAREGRKLSMGEAKELVSQHLPEFNLTGEPQFLLDDVHDAIERNSFEETGRLIKQIKASSDLEYSDKSYLEAHIAEVITNHVKELVDEKDAKDAKRAEHIVACIAYLGDYLRRDDLPEGILRVDGVAKALKEHVISTYENYYHDPEEVGHQIQRFIGLGLLKRKDVEKMSEISDIIGPKLIADFRERNTDFVERWLYFRERFDSRSQTRQELQKLAIERTEEMFRELEDDPRKPVVRLSVFMDIGLVSEKDVRGKTLAGVQKALSLADSYEGPDPDNPDDKAAMENGIRDIRARFGNKG